MSEKEIQDTDGLKELIAKAATIDDTLITTTNVWSARKIYNELLSRDASINTVNTNMRNAVASINSNINQINNTIRNQENEIQAVAAGTVNLVLLCYNELHGDIIDLSTNVAENITTAINEVQQETMQLRSAVGVNSSNNIDWEDDFPADYTVVDAVKDLKEHGSTQGEFKIQYYDSNNTFLGELPLQRGSFLSRQNMILPETDDDPTRCAWPKINFASYNNITDNIILKKEKYDNQNKTVYGYLYDSPAKYYLQYVNSDTEPEPNLYTVSLANNVNQVEIAMFHDCSTLKYVTLPNTVQTIGDEAFYKCLNIEQINVPTSLRIIKQRAFYYCSKIGNFSIPSNVSEIGEGAFEGCYHIQSMDIPASLTEIQSCTFRKCSHLKNVTFNRNSQLKYIGAKAFEGCTRLKTLNLPDSVVEIGPNAFDGCYNLSTLTIPQSLNIIKDEAFKSCAFISLDLSAANIFNIPYECFSNCQSLKNISLPLTLEGINSKAFFKCHQLENVTINSYLNNIGEYAFSETNINDSMIQYLLSKILHIDNYNNYIFAKCNNILTINFETAGWQRSSVWSGMFSKCENIQSVRIAAEYTSTIGSYAFENCTSLKTINTDSIEQFNEYSFYNCTALTSIDINSSRSYVYFYSHCFLNCTSLANVNFNYDNQYVYFNDYCFNNTGITSITFLNRYRLEGKHVFENCKKLTRVTWNANQDIKPHTFAGCSNLTSVTFNNCGSYIYAYAFYECTNLSEITLSSNVYSIYSYAFYKTSGLPLTIYLQYSGMVYFGENVFNSNYLNTIYVRSNNLNNYRTTYPLYYDKFQAF